jgi:4-carboxymuconolactone decarboxylase
MRFYRPSDIPKAPVSSPLFVGEVMLQDTPMPDGANDYTLRVVTYQAGARNVVHRHTSDQLIIVTAGTGLVGAGGDVLRVLPGDIVIIPASEYHWHGADTEGEVTQVSVTARSSTTDAQPASD